MYKKAKFHKKTVRDAERKEKDLESVSCSILGLETFAMQLSVEEEDRYALDALFKCVKNFWVSCYSKNRFVVKQNIPEELKEEDVCWGSIIDGEATARHLQEIENIIDKYRKKDNRSLVMNFKCPHDEIKKLTVESVEKFHGIKKEQEQ